VHSVNIANIGDVGVEGVWKGLIKEPTTYGVPPIVQMESVSPSTQVVEVLEKVPSLLSTSGSLSPERDQGSSVQAVQAYYYIKI
jgi:hypothetical protein